MDRTLIEAAKLACAHEFIMGLGQGYATRLSEKGSNISGGQRQRIAIARTIIANPQLLVMDGGTARLHVGDQVPIITRTSSSTATEDNRITNEIEYRDTGVTLDITPKVKSSGTVTLNISQNFIRTF